MVACDVNIDLNSRPRARLDAVLLFRAAAQCASVGVCQAASCGEDKGSFPTLCYGTMAMFYVSWQGNFKEHLIFYGPSMHHDLIQLKTMYCVVCRPTRVYLVDL